MAEQKTFRLAQLAEHLGAQLVGDGNCEIHGLATIQNAGGGDISFIANPAYKKYLASTSAAAVILHPDLQDACKANKLLLDNPYLGFAKLTALFVPHLPAPAGIHPSAVVDPTATVAADVIIGPHVVIGPGANIGSRVHLEAGCFVGQESQIGADSHCYPNVTVYHGVTIGQRAIFHAGVVVGADGFGIAPDGERWVKVHQLGGVVIGDDVELGANTCVDRGALGNTVIADGVKADNLVQIAHNVKIGANTAMAGCSAVSGSTTIGANCAIGGGAGIIGHLSITDRVTITAMSLVTKSIKEPGVYSSGTPILSNKQWRKSAVRFAGLNDLYQRVKRLEDQ